MFLLKNTILWSFNFTFDVDEQQILSYDTLSIV